MQQTEKNTVKKTRFNIIDLLVVIVIIAAIATVAVRLDIADKIVQATSEDSARVTLLVSGADQESVTSVSEGDKISWQQENCDFGTIVRKDVANAVVYNTVEDGTYVKTTNPERYDVTFTVDTKGTFTEDGYMLGGKSYLAAGRTVTFFNGKTVMTSIVIAVDEIGE